MQWSIVCLLVVSMLCIVSGQIQTKQQTSSQANADLINMLMTSQTKPGAPKPKPAPKPAPIVPAVPRYQVRRPAYNPWTNLLMNAYLLDNVMGVDLGWDFNLIE